MSGLTPVMVTSSVSHLDTPGTVDVSLGTVKGRRWREKGVATVTIVTVTEGVREVSTWRNGLGGHSGPSLGVGGRR